MAEWAATFGATLKEGESMNVTFSESSQMDAKFGEVQKVSTSNYEDLYNKPSINGVQLIRDKSFEDLGVDSMSNMEIKQIFNNVFGG